MAPLVTLAEAKVYLGPTPAGDDALLQTLVDAAVLLLAEHCGRAAAPWSTVAQAGRVEVCDGTGSDVLWLPYPIASVASVAIGRNPSTPDETLSGADADVLQWIAGSACLARVDGGVFSHYGARRSVRVTYDTQADAPADAKLAVNRAVAALYQQRGSEDASSERIGGVETTLARVAEGDAVWQQVVALERQWTF